MSSLQLQATTATNNPTGYALVNGTGNIISWTAPNDGLQHRVLIFAGLHVTSGETGGQISVTYTMPDGTVATTAQIIAGGQGTGTYATSPTGPCLLMIEGGTAVAVKQNTALSGGAAVLWAEIWGS